MCKRANCSLFLTMTTKDRYRQTGGRVILVSLIRKEVEALETTAATQGVSADDIIRAAVLEALQRTR